MGRIRERAAFARFRTDGRRFGCGVVWCTWVEDDSAAAPRVAFAVGRPVGSAVTRNQVRRRLRALLERRAREGRLPPGDYLVGVRAGAGTASFADLEAGVAGVVEQIERARGG